MLSLADEKTTSASYLCMKSRGWGRALSQLFINYIKRSGKNPTGVYKQTLL